MTAADSRVLVHGVIKAMTDVAETVILPRFRQLAKADIRAKTYPGDLVTIADEESERALGTRLNELLPGSRVVGEEAAFADPTLFDLLLGNDPVWIIDPIDGTANFVNGQAAFAVVVALVHGGETVMGLIHEPLESRTLWAEKGKGAWQTPSAFAATSAHDKRIVIPASTGEDLSTMVAAMHNKDLVALKGKFARNVRQGSAAHDYWCLADGRIQVLAYRKLKPWDHAAGLLIHEEAGGYNRLLSGDRYCAANRNHEGILCAPNQAIWQKVHELAVPQLALFPLKT